jgi:hypothetical protein
MTIHRNITAMLAAIALQVLALLVIAPAVADDQALRARIPALVTEHFLIDSDTPGIQLYVRNKRPKSPAPGSDRILLGNS